MALKENQLDSLRMVTGNIISLSIIDSENFDKVLEKLAEKSEDLKELYENLAKEQAVGASKVATKTAEKSSNSAISTATTVSSDMAIKDLYNKLEEMNGQLKVIASNSGNLSSYVNELRGAGDVMLKH
jgi:archaellum component FlaC